MGSALSIVKQRKMRRHQLKKIFSVQKLGTNVLLPEIPKKSRMVIMNELSKELRSLYPQDEGNYRRQFSYSDSSIEGQRIPMASPMVVMKNLRRQLQSLSDIDVAALANSRGERMHGSCSSF